MGWQRPLVCDPLAAHSTPSWVLGRVVLVRRYAVQKVARPNFIHEVLRIVRVKWILHRIQVVEVPPELVETVQSRQIFVAIAEVVLPELTRRVAFRLESRRDC